MREVDALDVLHREVDLALVLAGFADLDDVRMRERARGVGLAQQPQLGLVQQVVRPVVGEGQELERDDVAVSLVDRAVDGRGRAAAELLLQAKMMKQLARTERQSARAVGRRLLARGHGFSATATSSGLPNRGLVSPAFLLDPPDKPRSHPPRLESSGMRGPIRYHPDPRIINGHRSRRYRHGPDFQKLMGETATWAAVRSRRFSAASRVLASPRSRFPVPGSSMAKPRTVFVCSSCGADAPRWSGQCAACGEWNTLAPFAEARARGVATKRHAAARSGPSRSRDS